MRFAVVKTIYKAALKNDKIFFLTGDLDHACEIEFKKNISQQYLNVGIAEQNMMGIAAGLALSGLKVFVYSIVPFVTMRCFEQVKNDICYQNVDVTIIGVGGGFAYGPYGNTHCSIEDIAVMRVLPNMKIAAPANPQEANLMTQQLLKIKGPTYMRIGRGQEPLPAKRYPISFGRGYRSVRGKDISLLTYGTILSEVEKAARILKENDVSCEVINMHTIKPLDKNLILNCIKTRKGIFTIEEASIIGGLGDAVAEIISENNGNHVIFKRFGVNDKYLRVTGTQEYLRGKHGITASKIAQQILKLMHKHDT